MILHLPLKKSVHPFSLKAAAVHIRSDQDTNTIQDAVLELALSTKELVDRLSARHDSDLEGVLVLVDELTLTHNLPISIFWTRMATSDWLKVSRIKIQTNKTLHTLCMKIPSEPVPVPSICFLSKSLLGPLLVGCNCCHIVAPVFRSLDSIPLILQL